MNCKYLRKRQLQYIPYLYCSKLKKEITFNDCKDCHYKEYKEQKPIKKRSNKLARAEKERFSIITQDLDNCVICGKKRHHLHEIFFGTGKRQLSMKYGLVIPLCYKCHDIIHKEAVLQGIWYIKGQTAFEKEYPNLDFLEIFGKNYKKKR